MAAKRRCGAGTVLDDQEFAQLAALPAPMHELRTALRCELENRHAGLHLALGQTSAGVTAAGDARQDTDWWIAWVEGTRRRRLVPLPPCPADDPLAGADVCTLPEGHVGDHSYAIEAVPPADEGCAHPA